MFTGIVKAVGKIQQVTPQGQGLALGIQPNYEHPWELGASVAVNGICLTIVQFTAELLTFELSEETLAKTTAASWQAGLPVNIEPALRLGDELGGHWFAGHVDEVGQVLELAQEDAELGTRYKFSATPELLQLIATKGSIAVDGVSLTVNHTDQDGFFCTAIPWTKEHTNFHSLRLGDGVNLEADTLARYAANYLNNKL